MRTNVVLDDTVVERAKALTGIKTTDGVIDEALRLLIQLHEQSEVRELRGRLRWEGDLAAMRESHAGTYDVKDEVEETATVLRRARAEMAASRLRKAAATGAPGRMTAAEIEAEITQARRERGVGPDTE
jgi:hypothetical protein